MAAVSRGDGKTVSKANDYLNYKLTNVPQNQICGHRCEAGQFVQEQTQWMFG